MEASPQITGSTTTASRRRATRSKKIAAVAALGLAGVPERDRVHYHQDRDRPRGTPLAAGLDDPGPAGQRD
jgi:hypothetical protein